MQVKHRNTRIQHSLLAIALSATCIGSAYANNAIDSHVKAALYDVERAEKQAAGLTASRVAAVKRVRRSLENARLQLQASKHSTHESWQAVDSRLSQLEQKLVTLTAPKTRTATRPASRVSVKTSRTPTQASAYEQELLATLERQADGLIQRVQKEDALSFSQPRVAKRWRAESARMKAIYSKLPDQREPRVIAAGEKLLALDTFIEQRIITAQKSAAELGDVVSAVQAIDERSRLPMPRMPDSPLTDESLRLFIQHLTAMRESARQDHAYLKGIEGKTRTVVSSRISALQAATGKHRQAQIERHARQYARMLTGQFSTADFFASQVAEAKPQHLNRNIASIRHAIKLLGFVDQFEQGMGLEILATDQRRATYQTAVAQLIARGDEAVEQRRFPAARSDDPTLLAAAREVLSRNAYQVNPIRQIAITYDRQRKSTAEGEIDWGRVMTTVTVTGYEWDEFAVTTAEMVDGQIQLYYNLFKFFHKGGNDVPTGQWTLAERTRQGRILEQNLAE